MATTQPQFKLQPGEFMKVGLSKSLDQRVHEDLEKEEEDEQVLLRIRQALARRGSYYYVMTSNQETSSSKEKLPFDYDIRLNPQSQHYSISVSDLDEEDEEDEFEDDEDDDIMIYKEELLNQRLIHRNPYNTHFNFTVLFFYNDQQFLLFPVNQDTRLPPGILNLIHLFEIDDPILDSKLETFFYKLRESLCIKSNLSFPKDQEMVLDFMDLMLTISEDNIYSSEISTSDLLTLFEKINSNTSPYNQLSIMKISLRSRLRFGIEYNKLLNLVLSKKGLPELKKLNEEKLIKYKRRFHNTDENSAILIVSDDEKDFNKGESLSVPLINGENMIENVEIIDIEDEDEDEEEIDDKNKKRKLNGIDSLGENIVL